MRVLIATLIALSCPAYAFAQQLGGPMPATTAAPGGDTRVQLMSPANGAVVHSGDVVPVMGSLSSTVKPVSMFVDTDVLGTLAGTPDGPSTFNADVEIPADFTGPIKLTPAVQDVNGAYIFGVPATIIVRPPGDLLGIGFAQPDIRIRAPGEPMQLQVTGIYSGNATASLTAGSNGSHFSSSNADVVTIDKDGLMQTVGYGTAVITVQNGRFYDQATVTIEDPDHPLPPQDVTNLFSFKPMGAVLDPATGYYVENIEFNSISGRPVIGPLFFVLMGLPADVTLIDGYRSQILKPQNTPYIVLPLPDNIAIPPHGGLKLHLQFHKLTNAKVTFTPMVFRSAAPL